MHCSSFLTMNLLRVMLHTYNLYGVRHEYLFVREVQGHRANFQNYLFLHNDKSMLVGIIVYFTKSVNWFNSNI